MIRSGGRVRSIGLGSTGRSISQISCAPDAVPSAGQAVLCVPSDVPPVIPFTLYPLEISDDGFRALVPAGQRWLPGEQLDLIGPVGRGFTPPERARRWLLVAAAGSAWSLQPLIRAGLARGAAVALTCPEPPPDLAADVELLPAAADALDWADYLAVDLGLQPPADLRTMLGIEGPFGPPCPTDVLLSRDLVCGFGGCLGCGLPTADGWGLICQRGPVFPWSELRV